MNTSASEPLLALARVLPEPLLFLSLDGELIGANAAASELLHLGADKRRGQSFSELFATAETEALRSWRRVLDPLPAAIRRTDGSLVKAVGCRLRVSDGPDVLMVRLWQPNATERFVLLSQKIAQLDDEVRRRKRAQSSLERLQALTGALSLARTPEDVASVVLNRAVPSAEAIAGALLVKDGARLSVACQVGYPEGLVARFPEGVPVDAEFPASVAFRERRPIFLETREAMSRQFPLLDGLPGSDAGAAAFVPLTIAEGALGVIAFAYRGDREFPPAEQELLVTFGNYCAQAFERARLFEAEHRARIEANEAERRKDEFLAMLGHELRNPLAPIITILDLIRIGGDHSLGRELAIIDRQARHLSKLVDDLLDVSRITRGKVELRRRRFQLSSAVDQALESCSPLIEDRRVEIVSSVPAKGLALYADQSRITQVLANLINNAAKYSDPGGRIELSATQEQGRIVLRVRDHGAGVAPELLPRMFEPFLQGTRPIGQAPAGLGLGLAIVRNLVELHGGTVSASSAGLGQGTEVVVRLPAAPPADATPFEGLPALPRAIAGAPRVLVVDDNVDAASLVAEALELLGYTTRTAADGPGAIRAAREFRPSAALLDIGLPVMDGYEVATALRKEPDLADVRLVALTGYGQASDIARSRAAGFDFHLVKPVDLSQLCSVLAELLERR